MSRKPQAEKMLMPASSWQMPVVKMLKAPVVKPIQTPSWTMPTPTIRS